MLFSSNKGLVNFYVGSSNLGQFQTQHLDYTNQGAEDIILNDFYYSTSSSLFPSPTISGSFEWSYNGIDLPCQIPTGAQPLTLLKSIGQTNDINGGNPNHDYYDIDLTVNDRGRTGGQYSILNYNPTVNPSNGKAYIFDLEMPADLFTGQQVDIKAKGYHKN
ncbi:MAG: hypothetical protein WCG93_14280 [Paludibacter sp.]